MKEITWLLETTGNPRFPYRVSIKKGEDVLLCLWVQDRWPGQKGNVFCVRDKSDVWEPLLEEIERVPVVAMRRYGKRLVVVLDRPVKKRCDFLFLKKKFKSKEGEYEQIFWRTERGLRERRPKVRVSSYVSRKISILIDTGERYPWKFPGAEVKREALPVGDYALLDAEGRIIAVVERKTFENMLASIGTLDVFHQQLTELKAYKHSALVIEANYSDFLNPEKLKFYSPSFLSKAIGDIFAFHPGLSVVFAGNRKLAAEWTYRYFFSVAGQLEDRPPDEIVEMAKRHGERQIGRRETFFEIKKRLLQWLPDKFTFSDLREGLPDVDEATLRRILSSLKKEGLIVCHGRGRKAYWERADVNSENS